ncbi:MAG TPA: Flp pilus assembly protein CpaB [Beijerinckiaceae bacterium]|nr:Flp pilus assembly protein CpaB [Beijerinckiaceae bacterium]
MRSSNLIVAGVALAAGLGAWVLSGPAPQPIEVQANAPAPTISTVDVLVAAVEIPVGGTINDAEMKWVAFPTGASDKFITKVEGQDVMAEVRGSIARYSFAEGEPLRREKIVKVSGGAGFLSAVLPVGKRAVAIKTESAGENSAGGFILPNDFVDVVAVMRDEEASKARGLEVFRTTTVLTGVRVLAIGQNIQERNGEKFITGQTATLELDPVQGEKVMLAQRVGTLTLALRSLRDASKSGESIEANDVKRGVNVVRFGQAQEMTVK